MLEFRDLSFAYGELVVFERFSLRLNDGERLAILGPSGCGKTTLLHLAGGLDAPSSGNILRADGTGAGPAAFVFQEPRLLPWRTLIQNIELPLRSSMGAKAARERARRFLALVSLADRESAYPSELSGGQRQRISLARAFAFPSDLVLMDEPFQSLDPPLRKQAMASVEALLSEEPRTLIFATHDPREALALAGRVAVLGGRPARIVLEAEVPSQETRTDEGTGVAAARESLERRIHRALDESAGEAP